jgi:glycosyltransferase involved in cell wall biosynthesis
MAFTGILDVAGKKHHCMKRIAIYSYNIRTLFSDHPEQATGGAEFQLRTLGTLLREKGYIVLFLVGDVQENDIETIDGFEFIKCFSKRNNSSFSKIVFLINALKIAHVDVLLERGSSTATFWLSLFARISHMKYIFCSASDINFAKDELDPAFRTRIQQRLFHYGLRRASNIVAQKDTQNNLLQKNFHRSATVIRNFSAIPHSDTTLLKEWDVIWVNNIIPYKQPETVIRLAEKLPSLKILMIGGSRNASYYEEIKTKTSEYSNITFMGFVPQNEVDWYIARSKIMLNTTIVKGKYEEGFANSFLQAWQLGLPAVSLLSNPDNVLEKYSIGLCSLTEEKMADDIKRLLDNDVLYDRMSTFAKAYVKQHHNTNSILQQYLDVIES